MHINDKLINTLTGSELADSGCIKLSNGFMFQWIKKTAKVGGTAWGSFYYSDTSMGNWSTSFKTLYCSWESIKSSMYWTTSFDQSTTSAGSIRTFRPTSATSNETLYVFGIGTWK